MSEQKPWVVPMESSSAGQELTATTGVIVIAAYALLPLIAGAVALLRRDA